MKRYRFVFLMLCSVFIITSCQKDDKPPEDEKNSNLIYATSRQSFLNYSIPGRLINRYEVFNILADKLNKPRFEERWGNVIINKDFSYQKDGFNVKFYLIHNNNKVEHLLAYGQKNDLNGVVIIDKYGRMDNNFTNGTFIHPEIRKAFGVVLLNIRDIIKIAYSGLEDLPEGCYHIIPDPDDCECIIAKRFDWSNLTTNPDGGTSNPINPFDGYLPYYPPPIVGSGEPTVLISPSGNIVPEILKFKIPYSSGTGIYIPPKVAGHVDEYGETNEVNFDFSILEDLRTLALLIFIDDYNLKITVEELDKLLPKNAIWYEAYEGHHIPFNAYVDEDIALAKLGLAGQDWFYDEEYWNNSLLIFPTQDLPSYQDFYAAFPKKSDSTWLYGADKIYNLVGGKVQQARRDFPLCTNNTCALKVSIALNGAGIDIPNINSTSSLPGTLQGANGKYYFLNARSLKSWMILTFGTNNPEYFSVLASSLSDNLSLAEHLQNKKGIYIQDYGGSGVSGHADIFTGSDCSASGCFYTKSGYIHFWELK